MFPGNMNKMLAKAQKMQQQLQDEIAAMRLEGSAGGGVVTATVDGQKNLVALQISAEVMEDKDPALVADLVLAAVADAGKRIDSQIKQKTSAMMGSLGLPPGLGF